MELEEYENMILDDKGFLREIEKKFLQISVSFC